MTVLNVYDMALNLIGVVDTAKSVIWRPAYYDVGDFELYVAATDYLIELLQTNRLVVRETDISTDQDGNSTYTGVMIIKNIELKTDVENGDYLIITGRELKYLLHQRIIWTQTNLTGTAEGGIRQLVTNNAISPTDIKRVIPNLVLGAEAGLSDSIDKQITGASLDVAICDICKTYGYGWDMYVYNNQYVFIVYQGTDRSYGQSANPYVVFSDRFDNLFNTDYQLKTEAYANTALVGGEGEGTARKYASVGTDNTGLNRYETFIDASNVSSNNGSISSSVYTSMLQDEGALRLATLDVTAGFSGEVYSNGGNYVFNRDFFIGDLVTVINSYGISRNVRVLSAIESEDVNGLTLIPQFNY